MAPAPVRHYGLLRVPPAAAPSIARRPVDRVSPVLREPRAMECPGIRRDPREVVGLRDEYRRLGACPVRRDVDHYRALVSGPATIRCRRLGAAAGAALLTIATPAVPAWLRLTMGEPLGFVPLLGAL